MKTEKKSFVKISAAEGMVLTDERQVVSSVITTAKNVDRWREVSEAEGEAIKAALLQEAQEDSENAIKKEAE